MLGGDVTDDPTYSTFNLSLLPRDARLRTPALRRSDIAASVLGNGGRPIATTTTTTGGGSGDASARDRQTSHAGTLPVAGNVQAPPHEELE